MSAVVIVLVLLTFIAAKYRALFKSGDGQMTSAQFYFTTDLLGDETMVDSAGKNPGSYQHKDVQEGQWNLYGGGEHQVSIHLRNYYDELRVTEENIEYQASVEVLDKDGQTINNVATLEITGQTGDQTGTKVVGTLVADSAGKEVRQELVLNIKSHEQTKYDEGTTVEVTIQSTKPYKKEMKLGFKLYKVDTYLSREIRDKVNSPYAEMIIMTNVVGENAEGGIGGIKPYLQWSEDLSIDNTNNMTFQYDENGNFIPVKGLEDRKIQIDKPLVAGESRSIYFFKSHTDHNYSQKQEIIVPDGTGNYVITIGKEK